VSNANVIVCNGGVEHQRHRSLNKVLDKVIKIKRTSGYVSKLTQVVSLFV